MSHAPTHIVRALGNPTSSSAAPSSTSGGQSNSPDPYSNLFQGKPPIIIAFLGVGAFLAVMMMLYGYRRVVQGRRIGLYQNPGGLMGRGAGVPMFGGPDAAQDFGERPLFWDFWTSRGTEKAAEKVNWKDLMPLSTTRRTHSSGMGTSTKPPSPSPTAAQARRSNFRETFRSQLSTRKADNPEGSESSTNPCEVTMQVAVAIAMPHRHTEPDPEEVLEYSLGVVEIPWHEATS